MHRLATKAITTMITMTMMTISTLRMKMDEVVDNDGFVWFVSVIFLFAANQLGHTDSWDETCSNNAGHLESGAGERNVSSKSSRSTSNNNNMCSELCCIGVHSRILAFTLSGVVFCRRLCSTCAVFGTRAVCSMSRSGARQQPTLKHCSACERKYL